VKSSRVILALPAYNEREGLPALLRAFQLEVMSKGYEVVVVVVDDGSSDGTREVLEDWKGRLPIDVIRHPRNKGLGDTIRDALSRAAQLADPDDIIVTMDADNTHPPALIPKMVERIRSGEDIVIASRYRTGSAVIGLSLFRSVMSWGARMLFQLIFPIRNVRDYTCGFRAYRASFLQRTFQVYGESLVTERSFACMAEILLKVSRLHPKTSEVAMTLRYDLKQGTSKMRVGRTVFKTLSLMVRTRFASMPTYSQNC
jgi:dolichol-phosphate mannosyltransferase